MWVSFQGWFSLRGGQVSLTPPGLHYSSSAATWERELLFFQECIRSPEVNSPSKSIGHVIILSAIDRCSQRFWDTPLVQTGTIPHTGSLGMDGIRNPWGHGDWVERNVLACQKKIRTLWWKDRDWEGSNNNRSFQADLDFSFSHWEDILFKVIELRLTSPAVNHTNLLL